METETKFTPGPWIVSSNYDLHVVREEGGIICCCEDGDFTGLSQAKANARLVAASPDLLEACESLLKMEDQPLASDKCMMMLVAMDQARDAINKAQRGAQ